MISSQNPHTLRFMVFIALACLFAWGFPQTGFSLEASAAVARTGNSSNTEATAQPDETHEAPLSLAVFPWRLVGIGSDYAAAIKKGMASGIRSVEAFEPTVSYYDLENRGRPLPMEVADKNSVNRYWVRKDMAGWYEPDTGLVMEAGRKLGVDAVLMYSFDRGASEWITIRVFLVNVKTGRTAKAEAVDSPLRPELLRAPVEQATMKVLTEFQ